jgi:hypothetical protein
MILHLSELPPLRGPDTPAYKGLIPRRSLYLAPDAAQSLIRLETATGGLTYTDVYRGAEASRKAALVKRGVKRPGYSPHNYGLAIDIDLDDTLRRLKSKYVDLLHLLATQGWYCHRRDQKGPGYHESWHMNFLGTNKPEKYLLLAMAGPKDWDEPAEAVIQERYGAEFKLDPVSIQRHIAHLGHYPGPFDGDLRRPGCVQGVREFQKAWHLLEDGVAGPNTQRVLAYVCAIKHISAPLSLA